jgi:putative AbiEii toxin of type IV toxin-antitoxin system
MNFADGQAGVGQENLGLIRGRVEQTPLSLEGHPTGVKKLNLWGTTRIPSRSSSTASGFDPRFARATGLNYRRAVPSGTKGEFLVPTDTKAPDAMHFRSLQLKNVRAFGSSQSLQLTDESGEICRWNLILGENGVGKTTLMQALAVMRPVPAFKDDSLSVDKSADAGAPTLSRAEISAHENNEIMNFIRRGNDGPTEMTAVLETEAGRIEVGVEIRGSSKELDSVTFQDFAYPLGSDGPLVIGYGAGRHIGHGNLPDVARRDATRSLFLDAVDLYDAQELIEKLDYAAKNDANEGDGTDSRRFNKLKTVIASLLPGDLTAEDIDVRGPRGVKDPDESGVHVRTPSGMTPLADLSLGYQAMFAWTVDLAWRLFSAYPTSAEPLSESAIVLIDEVDLHLHPSWQRKIRRHLLDHFPKVQFIATTHSPVTAQETLSEGGNVAVVRWEDNEAHILNRPIPRGDWRYDQLLTSELFGFGSDRSLQAEAKLYERLELIRKSNRAPQEEIRLRELDEFVASLPTASSPSAESFEKLMMELAKDFPSGVGR